MRYSDRELDEADKFLGMSPEEQMEHYGVQQVHKKDELKPCPFCGCSDIDTTTDCGMAFCVDCGVMTTIELWNTRTEPKEQDVCPVDKIREAFKKVYGIGQENYTVNHGYDDHDVNAIYIRFKAGYQAGYKSQQAEIERLKAENEAMRCCGNCRNFIDNQPGLFHDSTYCEECIRNTSDQYPSLIDHWQPKENN